MEIFSLNIGVRFWHLIGCFWMFFARKIANCTNKTGRFCGGLALLLHWIFLLRCLFFSPVTAACRYRRFYKVGEAFRIPYLFYMKSGKFCIINFYFLLSTWGDAEKTAKSKLFSFLCCKSPLPMV